MRLVQGGPDRGKCAESMQLAPVVLPQLGSAQLGSAKHSLTKMGQAELSHSQISWLKPAELRLSRQLVTLGRIRKVNHIWYPAGLSRLKMEIVVFVQDFKLQASSFNFV